MNYSISSFVGSSASASPWLNKRGMNRTKSNQAKIAEAEVEANYTALGRPMEMLRDGQQIFKNDLPSDMRKM